MPKKNRCDIKSDCRRITEESLLSPYTEAISITNGSTKGAKPVWLHSPIIMVILVFNQLFLFRFLDYYCFYVILQFDCKIT